MAISTSQFYDHTPPPTTRLNLSSKTTPPCKKQKTYDEVCYSDASPKSANCLPSRQEYLLKKNYLGASKLKNKKRSPVDENKDIRKYFPKQTTGLLKPLETKTLNTGLPKPLETKTFNTVETQSKGTEPITVRSTSPPSKPVTYSKIESKQELNKKKIDKEATAQVAIETPKAICGIDNHGGTCFLSSIIQCLSNTDVFREYFVCNHYRDDLSINNDTCGELAEHLAILLKSLWSGTYSKDISKGFHQTVTKFWNQYNGFEQHDAQEFFHFLINGLHDELKKAQHLPSKQHADEPKSSQEAWNSYLELIADSKLIELFMGQLSSVIKCTHCNNESTCWDPFWDLSLSMPRDRSRADVEECLAAFTEQETLDENEKPLCSNCKTHRRSIKRLSIVRSPKILILHLKKFSNDGNKLLSEISVNQTITIDSKQYELYACVCHIGKLLRNGHYTAYCQHDTKWFHINDDKVKDVTDSFSMATLKDAYVLFYRQKSTPPA